MKTNIAFFTALAIAVISFSSCKKDKHNEANPNNPNSTSSVTLKKFYQNHGVKTKSYKINGATGGSFTTEKGTKVTIPANCFVNGGQAVTGEVTIQFKDIVCKSDMLLSDVGTAFFDGRPMKSGGEFFINALLGDSVIQIDSGMKIDIEQPLNGQAVDNGMLPMVLQDSVVVQDTAGNMKINNGWMVDQNNVVAPTGSSYIFSLYQFGYNGLSAGTWCNSDNPNYFSAFPQTNLNIHCNQDYDSDVFLVFKDENCMIHVYGTGGDNHSYVYAPQGKKCTVVAIGYLNGKFHASFTPITISANQEVTAGFQEITEEDFEAKLKTLN